MIIVEHPQISRVERQGWISLGVDVGAALVASALPLVRFIFSYLTILVHEMGHALTAWVFGYPVIPAFDFSYGGGVTIQSERALALLLIPLGLLAWMGWRHRSNPSARWGWLGVSALFLVLAATPAHRHLMIAMGHGNELIIATIFLYRALSVRRSRSPPSALSHAACGLFIVLVSLS